MKIRLLQEAIDDVQHQSDYYEAVASRDLSRRWRRFAGRTIRSLTAMPMRGARYPVAEARWHNVRRIPVQHFPNHFVYYEFEAASAILFIMRVLHGAQELTPLATTQDRDPETPQ